MSVRNCQELGLSLQKIVSRLLENDDLVKLLYYEDKDPLSKAALDKEFKQKESLIGFFHTGLKAGKNPRNNEFKNVEIHISAFVPLTNWIIKDTNLRPFAILGQLQSSLDGKVINGLGRLSGGDFELKLLTEEMSCYEQIYSLIEYD